MLRGNCSRGNSSLPCFSSRLHGISVFFFTGHSVHSSSRGRSGKRAVSFILLHSSSDRNYAFSSEILEKSDTINLSYAIAQSPHSMRTDRRWRRRERRLVVYGCLRPQWERQCEHQTKRFARIGFLLQCSLWAAWQPWCVPFTRNSLIPISLQQLSLQKTRRCKEYILTSQIKNNKTR